MTHPNLEKLKSTLQEMNMYDALIGNKVDFKDPGKIQVTLEIEQKHLSSPHTAHGGVVASMMDTILGFTALSKTITQDMLVATVELKVNYLRPVHQGDQLTGTAEIVSQGKSLVVVRGEIINQDMKMVSFGVGTFNQYPIEKKNLFA